MFGVGGGNRPLTSPCSRLFCVRRSFTFGAYGRPALLHSCRVAYLRHSPASRRFKWAPCAANAGAPQAAPQLVPDVPPTAANNGASGANGAAAEHNVAPTRSAAYPFPEIEAKWQAFWAERQTFRTPDLPELDTTKPKAYILDMFPYPSGAGLHGYTASDIVARYKRMTGHNVLHPIGWDAFGLPAEQYAIQTGTHPAITTQRNVARFRQQLQALGFSYDWSRELATTDPGYVRWTQWIFLQLFRRGLAYQAEVPVNWCPALGTVLANEEVINGHSERGDHPVMRLPMKQWMLRITAYADRLLADLDGLDWAESIKDMQRNWIGRSEGATIHFDLQGGPGAVLPANANLSVFTTRPDTLYGATYLVLAPEHALRGALTAAAQREAVENYVAAAAAKSDLERSDLQKDKTGVFTGSYAVNPASGETIPVWVADYVLGGYGAAAIMAVPAHDTRDLAFARAYGLPVRRVVAPAKSAHKDAPEDAAFLGEGRAINSSSSLSNGPALDGLSTAEAKAAVVAWLEAAGRGGPQVNYKLRDWLFARQRYWGEPFPIAFPEGSEEAQAIPEEDLPLLLPETDNFRPSGAAESPLASISDWVNFTNPTTGQRMRRETSTMPQWAGSCWYYLRYLQPWNGRCLVDPAAERYWLPVDLYVGGAEHAVLHLLYARFWHKVLFDIGAVSTTEPFQRLVSQGMILGEVEYTVFRNAAGNYVDESHPEATPERVAEEDVDKAGSGCVLRANRTVRVMARAHKMSKSRGNVVNPDDVVYEFGADSLRLYEMFLGPLRDTKVWNTRSVDGVHRFLARVYRLCTGPVSDADPTREHLRMLHATIKRVTQETEELRFNTAIAAMMEFVNAAYKWDARPRAVLAPFALLLSPYAPHLAEEMWQVLGADSDTLAYAPWPRWDEALLAEDTFHLPVQVNGKLRATVQAAKDIVKDDALQLACAVPGVAKYVEGKDVKKVVFVPGRILNIIVGK